MIRISQLKLQPNHTEKDLLLKLARTLKVSEYDIQSYQIKKQSVDARKKHDIKYVYTIDVIASNEQQILKKKIPNVSISKDVIYQFQAIGNEKMTHRPQIIGSGPAGLFCAYLLAKHGYQPIVYERGASVEERQKEIERFWETGVLNSETNVQFGEGGAGTFSDGKLNTLVKDVSGRNREVLEIFVENGAPKEILFQNKPHIGTDLLIHVIRNMREKIIKWGGEVHFWSKFVDFEITNGALSSITIESNNERSKIDAQTLVLAIGHSARDTFTMLYTKKLPMNAKSFAVGVRVEHLQTEIDTSQYGTEHSYELPAASYKLATNLDNGRGVYSFCMCPGGYVVNASSEEGRLAVNGMSYHARDGKNANSAIVVTVTPDDYGSDHPLSGMDFQRRLEQKAFEIGNGKIPVQCFADFCQSKVTKTLGSIKPQLKGSYTFANIREIFTEEINASLEEGIKSFDRQIRGFANDDTLLSGVESRTSSPIRIVRNESYQIDSTGIYPCGEGAGYAGGITSAAMDGMKIAEKIAEKYLPFDAS